MYCTYSYLLLLFFPSSLMFQVSYYHFLSVENFNPSFRVGQLATKFSFFQLRMSWFPLHSWSIFLLDTDFYVDWCHPNCFLLSVKCHFFTCCFQKFLSLVFRGLAVIYLDVDFFCVYALCIHLLLESICSIYFGYFSPLEIFIGFF